MTKTATRQQKAPVRRKQRPPLTEWMNDLGFAQRQRLRFLEARVLWEGKVNRSDVCEQFDVTPNHVTREIGDYRHYFPRNLLYDPTARAYRPSDRFEAKFGTGQPDEYLALLKMHATNPSVMIEAELGTPTPCDVIPEPRARFSQVVLRTVLHAIHEDHGVSITYQSFSRDEVVDRDIWPHAVAWTGDRWHIRAYDSRRGDYIDIVPQRITKAKPLDALLPDEAGDDLEWEETETVEIVPNPELTERQQAMVAQEYGMEESPEGFVWRVVLRRCLIGYFLHRYHLDGYNAPRTRRRVPTQRIMLKDPTVAEQHRFKAD